jgi:hypothetical protein
MSANGRIPCFWALHISDYDPLLKDDRDIDRAVVRMAGGRPPLPLVPRRIRKGLRLAKLVAEDDFERSREPERAQAALAGRRAKRPISATALAEDEMVRPADVWPLIREARDWFFPARAGEPLSDRSIYHRLARERKRQQRKRGQPIKLRRCLATPCRQLVPIGSPRSDTCSDRCYMRLYRARKPSLH